MFFSHNNENFDLIALLELFSNVTSYAFNNTIIASVNAWRTDRTEAIYVITPRYSRDKCT